MEQSRANWSARDTPGRTDQVLRARRAARQAGRHTLHAGPPSGRSRAAHVPWAFASMRSEKTPRTAPAAVAHVPSGRGRKAAPTNAIAARRRHVRRARSFGWVRRPVLWPVRSCRVWLLATRKMHDVSVLFSSDRLHPWHPRDNCSVAAKDKKLWWCLVGGPVRQINYRVFNGGSGWLWILFGCTL
jgi:hypothetical protein